MMPIKHSEYCKDVSFCDTEIAKIEFPQNTYEWQENYLFQIISMLMSRDQDLPLCFYVTIETSERPIGPKLVSADTEYSAGSGRIFGR